MTDAKTRSTASDPSPLPISPWTTWHALPRSARITDLLADTLVAAHELRAEMAGTSMTLELELIIGEIERSLRRLAS
jgi:hypothetical protein